MGLARKKSVQKHQAGKVAGQSRSQVTTPVAVPSRLEVELLCIRSAASSALVNHIDNIEPAAYSSENGLLELRFHLLVVFGDAEISGFHLMGSKSGLDASESKPLETTTIGSPGQVASFPSLSWAANSRFVVNTTIQEEGLVPGDLLLIAAQVGDQFRPVARVYITGKAAAAAAAEEVASS